MSLQEHVKRQLEQANLLEPTTRLIVGVSGGPDSLTLLHLLKEIYPPDRIHVAHLDHGLRPSAAAEAKFVAATATAWGIEHTIERIDTIALARQEGWSLEEAGRNARYNLFARLAAKTGAGAIAVGHNADDQAETVLMHLLRGSGLTGLRAMQPISHLPGTPTVLLLRPLLDISREQIKAYCRQHNLQPVSDLSNQDPTYTRNRIRQHLLPLLAEYNPQIKSHLRQLATLVAADDDLLNTLLQQKWPDIVAETTSDWIIFERSEWQALPLSLRRRSLRQAIARLHSSPSDLTFRALEQARQVAETGDTGAQTDLPGNLILSVSYSKITIQRREATIPVTAPQLPSPATLTLPIPGHIELTGHWYIEATELSDIDLEQIKANQDPWLAFIDIASATELQIRPRRPGERMQPLGMGGHSAKIKDIMINHKIDATLRPLWPLVTTDAHPIWLTGYHIDRRARVTSTSRRVIQLQCRQRQPIHI